MLHSHGIATNAELPRLTILRGVGMAHLHFLLGHVWISLCFACAAVSVQWKQTPTYIAPTDWPAGSLHSRIPLIDRTLRSYTRTVPPCTVVKSKNICSPRSNSSLRDAHRDENVWNSVGELRALHPVLHLGVAAQIDAGHVQLKRLTLGPMLVPV